MDTQGRAQAVTVISPVRRWWAAWLLLSWPGADRIPLIKRPLVQLSFIHVAHWALLTRVPRRGGRRLPHPYLIFHSNFNDDLAAYIDAFALIVPWRMRLMWHGIYGFPGPRMVDRFLSFVQAHAMPVQHYYCAYPHGSARMITQALELSDRHRQFADAAAGLTENEFAAAWEQFVHENQLLL
ncbi:MAG: hypothetical protein WBP81_26005 [Solirubrobacteraceae bacterium]